MTRGEDTFELRPIGTIESALTELAKAPRQGDEGAPEAWLVLNEAVVEGLYGLEVGAQVLVLTWLDRADRNVLRTVPRNELGRAERGVFATRSPDRPNPIGLHDVTILAVEGARVHVDRMEAIDGTPVLDIKPRLLPVEERWA